MDPTNTHSDTEICTSDHAWPDELYYEAECMVCGLPYGEWCVAQ